MEKRTVLAALLGGLALFAWESVAHMLLPLGEAGISALPNETAVMTAIKENIKDSGFYFFPAPENAPGMTSAQKQEAMTKAEERMRVGPTGIIIVHPNGTAFNFPVLLLKQFFADVFVMLIAAVLLVQMPSAAYGKKVMLVVLMGLIPALHADIPHWNWYGFPAVYTLAQIVTRVVGFLAGGLVLAKVVK